MRLYTKSQLKKHLESGGCLDQLLQFCTGQECDIFKADTFHSGENIIYIPDLCLNHIDIEKTNFDKEELQEYLDHCYTGDDFLKICDYRTDLAERLFWYCDWQPPDSALPEVDDEDTEEESTELLEQ